MLHDVINYRSANITYIRISSYNSALIPYKASAYLKIRFQNWQ